MEQLTTSIDQHGRMLIPSELRQKFDIQISGLVNLEIDDNGIRIVSSNKVIDEMHTLFTKNQIHSVNSIVEDFLSKKHDEYNIEENRSKKI